MEIRETKDLLRKLKPILGRKTDALWLDAILPNNNQFSTDLLRIAADRWSQIDFSRAIRLPPPEKHKLAGQYNLGTVIYPDTEYSRFSLHENELPKHIFICGMTGTGKTNLSFRILQELARHRKPFLVFDWKRNYQSLTQLPELSDIQLIRPGSSGCSFCFNPLIPPPNTDPKHWMAMLVDVIKHAFFVGHGVEFFLRKGIAELYERYGIQKGKPLHPTFTDLEKLLQKEFAKGRESLWMSSAKRVLASLTFSGLLGDVLNVRTQPPIEALLDKNVVLELDNLATIEKVFFVEALLLWIYQYRKNNTNNREQFQHAIVIEEAHHILSSKKEHMEGEETVIETIIRMIREFGESVIVIDQEPSKVSNSILANTYCKVSFNLGNGKDIETISRSMSLNQEEREYIDLLGVGHAILKLKDRFSQPVHLRVPLVGIDKNMPVGTP